MSKDNEGETISRIIIKVRIKDDFLFFSFRKELSYFQTIIPAIKEIKSIKNNNLI